MPDYMAYRLAEFRKLIYEPTHEETTCWCKPVFKKGIDGNLYIIHNEQRDVLADFVRKNFL